MFTAEQDDRIGVSVLDGARRLGVGVSTMKLLVGRGEIKSFHIGRRHLLLVSSIREYAERLASGGSAA